MHADYGSKNIYLLDICLWRRQASALTSQRFKYAAAALAAAGLAAAVGMASLASASASDGTPRYIGGAPPVGSGTPFYYITITALDEASTGLNSPTTPAPLALTTRGNTTPRPPTLCPTHSP